MAIVPMNEPCSSVSFSSPIRPDLIAPAHDLKAARRSGSGAAARATARSIVFLLNRLTRPFEWMVRSVVNPVKKDQVDRPSASH